MSNGLLAGTAIDRQIEIERRSTAMGESKQRDETYNKIKSGQAAGLPPISRFVEEWIGPVAAEIRRFKREGGNDNPWDQNHIAFVTVLGKMNAERLAAITLHEMFNVLLKHPEGFPTTRMGAAIWRVVKAEMLYMLAKQHDRAVEDVEAKVYPKLVSRWRKATPRRILAARSKTINAQSVNEQMVKLERRMRCGIDLMWCVFNACAFKPDAETTAVPAFRIGTTPTGSKRMVRLIWMDFTLQAHVHYALQHDASLHPLNMPMVADPIEWGHKRRGGRYTIRKPLIVRATRNQRKHQKEKDMPLFYRGLNWIAATKHAINPRIKEVIEQIWAGGRDWLEVPAQPPLERHEFPKATPDVADDKEKFSAHLKHLAELHKTNQSRVGARTIFAGGLSIARSYANEPYFFFDQFCDFRGRMYPRGDYLNYASEKWARAMLQFGKPVDPGESGRKALRIWAATCYGVDKVSYAEREKWTLDHSREIARCAAMGLDEDFWQKADSPWEFLAACHALTDDEAAARLPIGRDGSANGLQHLAAMTRDESLASLVNLIPGEQPSDLYTRALKEVERIIRNQGDVHVDKMHRVSKKKSRHVKYSVMMADVLPWIKRKVCKQTFLAFGYGVTQSGAIDQIQKQMIDHGAPDNSETFRVSIVLANACIRAMEAIAPAAAAVMRWMRQCARMVCTEGVWDKDKRGQKTGMVSMSWYNGVGFFVEQPYRNVQESEIETLVGRTVLNMASDDLPVDRKAQIRGVAPNVVHSYDQEHMILTACQMLRRGYEFYAQHDQYNCHAAHVGYMHQSALEQMAGMYQHSNRLLDLHTHWSSLRPDLELPMPPEQGTYDPSLIASSQYAFH